MACMIQRLLSRAFRPNSPPSPGKEGKKNKGLHLTYLSEMKHAVCCLDTGVSWNGPGGSVWSPPTPQSDVHAVATSTRGSYNIMLWLQILLDHHHEPWASMRTDWFYCGFLRLTWEIVNSAAAMCNCICIVGLYDLLKLTRHELCLKVNTLEKKKNNSNSLNSTHHIHWNKFFSFFLFFLILLCPMSPLC